MSDETTARRRAGCGKAGRAPSIRYRIAATDAPPAPGEIVMGNGPRVRRAYRVLSATKAKNGLPMLGLSTWKLAVEPMTAARGRAEIAAGAAHWTIIWDRRG